MKSREEISAIQAALAEKGVKYCMGTYVDIHGVPKGKVVPLSHLQQMAAGSELYTGYALDGLGQQPNDNEIASVPDLDHIIQLPWQREIAWMPADNSFRGEPYPLNTRVALKNVMAQAAEMGFGFNLGIEAELFVLRKNADGSLEVPNPEDKLNKPCYDTRSFLHQFGWLDKMATAIDDLGWDLYSFDHEDANGQYEFDFMYADAVTTCDRFTFLRLMAKELAREEGLLATFMPKPFGNKTGNGAHFNMSLSDINTGENLFKCASEEDPNGLGITQLGYQFIGGIIKHGRSLCAAFAPTVNSYKRLVRQGDMPYFTWAPVFNSYGSNNRTNSVRVPMNGGRCESRNADGAVNPYLAAALALAAGLEGIREGIDPGKPQEDNLYNLTEAEREERGIEFLPRSLNEAIQAFAADPFIRATLGSGLTDEFIRYKQEEWNSYHQAISSWEIERYAHMF
ncbi:type III glutamate--ammonia ligase [Pseudomaricurvus alcaniphilus]|uniref:type III glutamate--ammonia ligase n=1 Tax=Pseudomaricurvus alcaniphilus TaxID=1166482 RepID=UPI00140C9C6B|nr:type III glutamate--ammonia ligase [Pseudomaricurvus alcaniphilus]NHN39329.1 type III glutamate--ammonia ligase [Pseudomaricurvus alcaniphilus]